MAYSSFRCVHPQLTTFCKYTNCILCGTLVIPNDEKGSSPGYSIKDPCSNTRADISPSQLFSTMICDQYMSKYYNPSAKYLSVIFNKIKLINYRIEGI